MKRTRDENLKIIEDVKSGKLSLSDLRDIDPKIMLVTCPDGKEPTREKITEALENYWRLYDDRPPYQRPPSLLVIP